LNEKEVQILSIGKKTGISMIEVKPDKECPKRESATKVMQEIPG